MKTYYSPVVLRKCSEIFGAEIPIMLNSAGNMRKERLTPNFVGIRFNELLAQKCAERILLYAAVNYVLLFLNLFSVDVSLFMVDRGKMSSCL
jgi:hypothetical protein